MIACLGFASAYKLYSGQCKKSATETREPLTENFSGNQPTTEQRINFEQFCVIASEGNWHMTNQGINCENRSSSFVPSSEKRDLYIGAGGKDQFWREPTSQKMLGSSGLSCHRMSLDDYNIQSLPQELQRMSSSRLILLIVTQHSRGISILALAAYLIGLRRKLVLCVQALPEDCVVSGEKLTEKAIKDYNRGRVYLTDYAEREGVPVFTSIAEALQHSLQLFKKNTC